MNKESSLNDPEITKTPDGTDNTLSASTLTKALREIEYKEIPEYILLKAAERGKNFHDIIQEFVKSGNHPPFVDLAASNKLSKLDKRIHETVNFLKKDKSLKLGRFLGSEKLHYVFYKDELLATYVDLEFHDYIVELKTSNIKANDSPLALLIFEIQLLIQYLCTVRNGDTYSLQMKKAVIQEVLSHFSSPKKLICYPIITVIIRAPPIPQLIHKALLLSWGLTVEEAVSELFLNSNS
ncbi:12288_t:CDS:2 [Entrophospora sp. SA101]|nr:12288_t:CDS:2 [Entrophospora sp. SA101]